MSRLRAVGLYHDLNAMDHQQEFSSPFEPLPHVEQVTHMPTQVNEIFIAPDIEKLAANYDALHDLPAVQMDKADLFLEKTSHADIPHLEQNLTAAFNWCLNEHCQESLHFLYFGHDPYLPHLAAFL